MHSINTVSYECSYINHMENEEGKETKSFQKNLKKKRMNRIFMRKCSNKLLCRYKNTVVS